MSGLSKSDLPSEPIARPPSGLDIALDRSFRGGTVLFCWLSIALLAYIVFRIGATAIPAIREYGFQFLVGTTWDPNNQEFGILPEIWGTLYSSSLALLLAAFFGVSIAIFLTQDFLPTRVALLFKNIVELLAAIPSVVYGLWGFFVLIPAIRPIADGLNAYLGWTPFFSESLISVGMLPATLVLAIMILPTVTAISRDAIASVPEKIKEAAYGLGATRWEAILRVIVPTAGTGIFGALVLAFGRALGETMALAMLIGGAHSISLSLLSPANTLAALMANNLPEADTVQVGALMYAALVLMAITLTVNIAGTAIVRRALKSIEGSR